MKRTPLRRKTPMRSQSQLRRTRIKPYKPKKESRIPDAVGAAVKRRSRGICERCQIKPGTELHHRVTRARGGPHDEFNLVHLCSECHHVHAHGQLEHPWYVKGRFLRGKYLGEDKAYREHYATAA